MDNVVHKLVRGIAYVAGEDKSYGFELGHRTSSVTTSSQLNTKSEDLYFTNTNITLGCYPNLMFPIPLSIKSLIGHKYSDLILQSPNYLAGTEKSMSEGLDGFPIFHEKNNQPITLSQLLSKNLLYLYEKPVNRTNVVKVACAIGIPIHFTDSQRTIVLDAAKNAGLNNPTLFHETTASALSYARGYHGAADYSETEKICVILDMGVHSMQVSIAKFTKQKLDVLSHAFDLSLGGKAFDVVLFNHFVGECEKIGCDVMKNSAFYWKLYGDCERMKMELDSRDEAFFQFVWNNQQMFRSIKREEFLKMCAPLFERVKRLLEKALSDAGLCANDIQSVKCVGCACRIPAIIKVLTDFFGRQLDRATIKGVGAGCAELATNRVKVHDVFPHSIAMSWNAKKVTIEGQVIIFPNGSPMDITKEVSFSTSTTFSVDFVYDSVGDSKIPTKIGRFKIGPFKSRSGEKVSGKFKVKLDQNGIFSVESAFILENGFEVKLQVSRLNKEQELLEDILEAKTTNEEANRGLTNEIKLLDISKETLEANDDGFEDCSD